MHGVVAKRAQNSDAEADVGAEPAASDPSPPAAGPPFAAIAVAEAGPLLPPEPDPELALDVTVVGAFGVMMATTMLTPLPPLVLPLLDAGVTPGIWEVMVIVFCWIEVTSLVSVEACCVRIWVIRRVPLRTVVVMRTGWTMVVGVTTVVGAMTVMAGAEVVVVVGLFRVVVVVSSAVVGRGRRLTKSSSMLRGRMRGRWW